MLNHIWLDYIDMENNDIKKYIFGCPKFPRVGGTLDTHVGHIGPHTLDWEKLRQKKCFFFLVQVAIKIQNDYVKRPY